MVIMIYLRKDNNDLGCSFKWWIKLKLFILNWIFFFSSNSGMVKRILDVDLKDIIFRFGFN